MDLLTCPTCKQSVLDDDATECPFCGSPMKGGAATARPGQGPATSGKSAPAKGAGKGASRTADPAEDDPFGVDPSIAAKATALLPKPTAGKAFEVKCPMCETVGYASPKIAGHSVRCCNPQCMVPVFTVKAPRKEEAPPPPPPRQKSPALFYAIGGGLLLAVAGATIWYLNSIQAPTSIPAGSPGLAGGGPKPPVHSTDFEPAADAVPSTESPTQTTTTTGNDRAADLKEALSRSVEAALQSPSIKKAYGRRMTALAYAHLGDLAATREQLEQLKKVSSQTPYESIPPLALYGWRALAESSDAALQPITAELKQLTPTLPKRGRFATESAVAAASILAAAGDSQTARAVLAEHRTAPLVEQLAAVLQLVNLSGTFDVDAKLPGRSAGDWQSPLESGVTLMLCQQQRWEAAEKWARETPETLARDEALLVFSESLGRHQLASNTPADPSRLKTIDDAMTPVGKVRHAALRAALQFEANNSVEGQKLLALAVEGLNAIPPATAPRLTSAKSVLDGKLSDGIPLQQGARAAAEIARIQAGLKQSADAWKSIGAGLKLLRGIGPGINTVKTNRLRLESNQVEGLRKELKKQLNLVNEDQIRREMTKFRERLDDLDKGANARFRGAIELLAQAIDMGLHVDAWKEILAADGKSDENDRDPLLGSALPALAAFAFEAAGDTAKAQSIRTDFAARSQEAESTEALRVLPRILEQLLDRGEVVSAVSQVNGYIAESGEMQESALRLASRMVDAGKVGLALQFVSGIQLESLREDGLFQVSARAARLDRGNLIKESLPKQMKVTDAAAVHAGLASGWGEADRAKPSAK